MVRHHRPMRSAPPGRRSARSRTAAALVGVGALLAVVLTDGHSEGFRSALALGRTAQGYAVPDPGSDAGNGLVGGDTPALQSASTGTAPVGGGSPGQNLAIPGEAKPSTDPSAGASGSSGAVVTRSASGDPTGSTVGPAPTGSSTSISPTTGSAGTTTPQLAFLATAAGTPAYRQASNSAFRLDVRTAPLDPTSPARLARLLALIQSTPTGTAGMNTRAWNSTVLTVPAGTPTTDVGFGSCPYAAHPDFFAGRGIFLGVPIPTNATPGLGGDGGMTIYDPATGRLWEFWKAAKVNGTWTACWGGRIDDVSTSRGYFDRPFGSAASSLVNAAGMVTIAEARAGVIPHALSIALPQTKLQVAVWPAQRTDGRDTHPDAIPEGARMRLDPTVNVDTLPMSRLGKALARAAQKYGLLVADVSEGVVLDGESGQLAIQAGRTDPWLAIFDKSRYETGGTVLDGFPWSRIQFVQDGWGR